MTDQGEKKLIVDLGDDSYPIFIKEDLLDECGEYIKKVFEGERIFILTDQHVNGFYGSWLEGVLQKAGYMTHRLVLEAGEATKSFATLPKIYEALLDFQMTRQDLLITLGGGVIGDLGGFAAATYLRGIPFVQMPTSLLAQVDSSVGGKVGVDLARGKNLVGSFYQPKAVLIDPQLLQTLPERYWRDGMAEVIKYGCIQDQGLLTLLTQLKNRETMWPQMAEIIYACCKIKKTLVEMDEKDTGSRLLLNFGHTLGHAIEAVEGYQGHGHGEAVAIGMQLITQISEAKGLTQAGTQEALQGILEQVGLPYQMPDLNMESMKKAIGLDKKNFGSSLKVILLKTLGESFIYTTNVEFFEELTQCPI